MLRAKVRGYVKPISEDSLKLLLFNKDKRAVREYIHYTYADTHLDGILNTKTCIENNTNLVSVLKKFNLVDLKHYTYALLGTNLITMSHCDSLLINDYMLLNIEVFHNINSIKVKEIFFKKVMSRVDRHIITNAVKQILNKAKNYTPIAVLKILVFISFLLKIKSLEYTNIGTLFEDVLLTNSSYLMLNLNSTEYLRYYIDLTCNLYLSGVGKKDLLNFITDAIMVSQKRDPEILNHALKLFNTIFKLKSDLAVDELFVDQYLDFVRFANKTLSKPYYIISIENINNQQSHKKEHLIQNYKASVLNCIQVMLESVIAHDINYKDFYIAFIAQYIELLVYLISKENDIKTILFLTAFLSTVVKKHSTKISEKHLTEHKDLVLSLTDKKPLLMARLGKYELKDVKILQQYQECLESIYPYLNKH
jgi:hypothetical protein